MAKAKTIKKVAKKIPAFMKKGSKKGSIKK